LKIAPTKEGKIAVAVVVLFVLRREFKPSLLLFNEDNV